VNSGALEFLKEQGANLLRVAMYSDNNYGGYLHSKDEQNFNKAIMYIGIENALAADMYVIADWHLLEDKNPLTQTEPAVEFFSELSKRYANNTGIIYEICNEPNGDTTWSDIKKYAEKVIPAIRKNSPDAIIIVGTPAYSSEIESVIGNELKYNNVMYAYHYYTKSENTYAARIDTAIQTGLPIFVTEWGIKYSKNGKIMSDEANQFVDFINKKGLSWAAWSFSNKDESYSVIKPTVTKISGWTNGDLTDTGKLIFAKMKEPENVKP
jgi:aryl-phospho-beta-D-glucosidase BglC (GH1 family)